MMAVPPEVASYSVTVEPGAEGLRIDAWLASRIEGMSRARIGALIGEGRVTRNGEECGKASAKTRCGDEFVVSPHPPAPAEPEPEDIPLDIVYEDADIIVIDKPAGLVVHPAPGHPGGTLVNALLFHCHDLAGIGGVERPGIVHRIDCDTTGLLVVAKNQKSMAGLQRQFQEGAVRKEYLALVHGMAPAEGEVSSAIGRDKVDRKKMRVARDGGGKAALSRFSAVERFGKIATLLKVCIHTGRTHQIRVHMASIGFPVAGDQTYGDQRRDRLLPGCPKRQMLHAAHLELDHPSTGARMVFERPPPADMAALLARCRAMIRH